MANPNTRETLKQYALRTLGKPVIEINVDDDQLEDRLDEALQYFSQYHYDGVERTYLKYKVTQADVDRIISPDGDTASSITKNSVTTAWTEQNNFILVPEAVLAVTRIFPLSNRGNQNMFDMRYQLRLNDLYSLTSTNILYYEQVQQQLSLMQHVLVGRTPIRFNQHMNRLYLDMDVESIYKDEYLIIECYRKLDPTNFTDVYNDMWLKKYATALCKYQWGENLSKFQGIALPGGVTLDGTQMKQEAQEEIQRLEEESRLNHDMLPMDMIG